MGGSDGEVIYSRFPGRFFPLPVEPGKPVVDIGVVRIELDYPPVCLDCGLPLSLALVMPSGQLDDPLLREAAAGTAPASASVLAQQA